MTNDTICKGICIKYVGVGSEAGLIYTIYIVVYNLSKVKLPNDQFVVVPIDELTITGNIDPRSKDVGYRCLGGSNQPHNYYFIGLMSTLPILWLIILGENLIHSRLQR